MSKDAAATAIGDLYRKARKSMVNSMKYLAEAGRKLAARQASLGHGNWLPWLEANAETLGFDTPRTAQRLLLIGRKYDASVVFDEEEAIRLNRIAWGHEDPPTELDVVAEPVEEPGAEESKFSGPARLAFPSKHGGTPVKLGGRPLSMMQPCIPNDSLPVDPTLMSANRKWAKEHLAVACRFAQLGGISGDELLEMLSVLLPEFKLFNHIEK